MGIDTAKSQSLASGTQENILLHKDNTAPLEELNGSRQTTHVGEPPAEWKPGRQEYLILLSLSIISLMVALDASIVAPALTTIAKDLGGTAAQSFWTGTSYLLTNAACQPFIAALSDIFGRKEILLLSVLFFTVGSILCCAANNFAELLAGRSIQGIGGGGIISMSIIIVTDIVPLRQRPKYSNFIQLAWAIGSLIGPLLGGLFAQYTTWRWIFYLNFPFCALGFVTIFFAVRLEAQRSSLARRFLQVDWVGGTIFIGSITSFLIGITWGGVQFPWSSYRTWLPLIVGVLGIIVSIAWEAYGATQAFIRLSVFKGRSAIAAYVCALAQGLLLYAQTYYLPFYLESIKGLSPTLTGVSFLALNVTFIPTSIIVAIAITKLGRFRWAVWSGTWMTVLGTGLLILLDKNTSTVGWIFIFLASGFGQGLLLSSLNFTIQAIADSRDVAYAAAMYAFLRTVGMALGVAIGGTVFQNVLAQKLAQGRLPVGIAKDAEGFVPQLRALPHDQYRNDLLSVYARSFQAVFATLTGISGFSAIVSLLLTHHSMDKGLDSEHVLKKEGVSEMQPEL